MEYTTQYKKNFSLELKKQVRKKAFNKLIDKIGYDAYKWRFIVKEIKQGN